MKNRILLPLLVLVLWGLFLATVIAIGNEKPAAPHRWHLFGAILNVADGTVIAQLPVLDSKTKERLTFATPEECISRVMLIGPVPAHDGGAMVFRCVRDDALPVK